VEHILYLADLSQTSFGHISINSSTILMVLKIMESPQKDLLINASHVLRQLILAEILSRSMSASKVQWLKLSQLSLCSEFDKENLMEFLLNSLLLIHFTTVAMHLLSHGPHVTLVMWHTVTCDLWCDHMWPSITPLWHCDTFLHSIL